MKTEIKPFDNYSFNEKIDYLFNQLLTWLSPELIKEKKDHTWVPWNQKKRYWTISFAECHFENKGNIINPFADIEVDVSEKMITMRNNVFCYQFPPDQILTIWRRIKKALKN